MIYTFIVNDPLPWMFSHHCWLVATQAAKANWIAAVNTFPLLRDKWPSGLYFVFYFLCEQEYSGHLVLRIFFYKKRGSLSVILKSVSLLCTVQV